LEKKLIRLTQQNASSVVCVSHHVALALWKRSRGELKWQK